MALDSGNKRGSAIAVNPASPVLPEPDGVIDAGDRAQLAQVFSGLVLAENPDPAGWRVIPGGSVRAVVDAGSPRGGIRIRGNFRAAVRAG